MAKHQTQVSAGHPTQGLTSLPSVTVGEGNATDRWPELAGREPWRVPHPDPLRLHPIVPDEQTEEHLGVRGSRESSESRHYPIRLSGLDRHKSTSTKPLPVTDDKISDQAQENVSVGLPVHCTTCSSHPSPTPESTRGLGLDEASFSGLEKNVLTTSRREWLVSAMENISQNNNTDTHSRVQFAIPESYTSLIETPSGPLYQMPSQHTTGEDHVAGTDGSDWPRDSLQLWRGDTGTSILIRPAESFFVERPPCVQENQVDDIASSSDELDPFSSDCGIPQEILGAESSVVEEERVVSADYVQPVPEKGLTNHADYPGSRRNSSSSLFWTHGESGARMTVPELQSFFPGSSDQRQFVGSLVSAHGVESSRLVPSTSQDGMLCPSPGGPTSHDPGLQHTTACLDRANTSEEMKLAENRRRAGNDGAPVFGDIGNRLRYLVGD